ncbi:hypothetical protein [Agromyces aureus]|nr:hypothetical protein [Agromyces aureus]
MTSRSRIAWASVAMTLAVLLGASMLGPVSVAAAADEPAYSVDVVTAPKSAAGGGRVTATVTVTTNRPDAYPDLARLSVGLDWNPPAGLTLRTTAPDAPVGCDGYRTADGSYSSAPVRGGACDVTPSPTVGGVVAFTYVFALSGVPPSLPVVQVSTVRGWEDTGDGLASFDLVAEDIVGDQDYFEMGPVFSAAVSVDRKVSTTGIGERVTATFTVVHAPSAAPTMNGSQVQFAINWPTFFTPVGGTTPADACDDGLINGSCAITEPTSARKTTVFTMQFDVPPGNGGQGAVSIIGQGGWYVPPGPIISIAPLQQDASIRLAADGERGAGAGGGSGGPGGVRGAAVATAADVRQAIVKAAPTPRPPGALDIPGTWTGVEAASVIALYRPFPMEIELRPQLSTLGEEGIEGVVRVRHDEAAAVTLFGLELDVDLSPDAALVPVGDPVGCATYVAGICTIVGLDAPGSEVEITMAFAPPDEVGVGFLAADQVAGRFEFDGGVVAAPDPWLESAYDSQITDAELVTLDVVLSEDYVWEGGPMLSALVTPTRAAREVEEDSSSYELWGTLFVRMAITWPDYLTPMSTPTGCTPQVTGMVCEVVLEEPGAGPTVALAFSIGPGVVDGLVAAEGVFLQNTFGDESTDLPVEWIVPDDEPLGPVEPFIPLDVEVERDLVWEGGDDVGATITATRNSFVTGSLRDPLGSLVVEVAITWPAFLHPTAPPTGCESWDGTICTITLSKPGAVALIGLEFSVGGAPPGSVLTGDVRAEATRLFELNADGPQELPTEWVTPDADPVTRIRATVTLDLALDRDPGYTGGKQLVVTTTITRESPGATLPGLEVGLDFDWAGYLTKTADTGCASFSGTTCVVTGLDAPGASAVVTLTFAMPPPTLPPVPEVLPRTNDLAVDGVSLSFVPPPPPAPEPEPVPEPEPWPPDGCFINDEGVCVCTDEFVVCPTPPPVLPEEPDPAPVPEPLDGTLPPSWIGEDREPFTVLQPNLLIAQTVASPGDGIEAYGKYLPPNANVTLRWEGLATMSAVQWPNPDDPTEARWSLVILRWQFAGARTLIMHSEDGQFADIPSSNQLLVVPRTGMGPDLVGRGG